MTYNKELLEVRRVQARKVATDTMISKQKDKFDTEISTDRKIYGWYPSFYIKLGYQPYVFMPVDFSLMEACFADGFLVLRDYFDSGTRQSENPTVVFSFVTKISRKIQLAATIIIYL